MGKILWFATTWMRTRIWEDLIISVKNQEPPHTNVWCHPNMDCKMPAHRSRKYNSSFYRVRGRGERWEILVEGNRISLSKFPKQSPSWLLCCYDKNMDQKQLWGGGVFFFYLIAYKGAIIKGSRQELRQRRW